MPIKSRVKSPYYPRSFSNISILQVSDVGVQNQPVLVACNIPKRTTVDHVFKTNDHIDS